MSNIRVDVGYLIKDGTEIVFRSPVDCAAITGLIVYYTGAGGNTMSKEFALADAHGNNVGDIDYLFAENVVVKVILDVTHGMAFVQNADTNAYLEAKFSELWETVGVLAESPSWVESHEHPGCFYRMVDGEAEWLNAPALKGVEYRTAERAQGYIVYTRRINCGFLVNGNNSVVYSDSVVYPVRYAITVGMNCTYSTYGVVVDSTLIKINNPNATDLTLGNAFVQVWYTKEFDDASGFYITKHPQSATKGAADSVTLTIEVSHPDPDSLTYEWLVSAYTDNYWVASGATGQGTNTIIATNAATRYYKCVVKDENGNTRESDIVVVTVV